jgi:hypothetical protein
MELRRRTDYGAGLVAGYALKKAHALKKQLDQVRRCWRRRRFGMPVDRTRRSITIAWMTASHHIGFGQFSLRAQFFSIYTANRHTGFRSHRNYIALLRPTDTDIRVPFGEKDLAPPRVRDTPRRTPRRKGQSLETEEAAVLLIAATATLAVLDPTHSPVYRPLSPAYYGDNQVVSRSVDDIRQVPEPAARIRLAPSHPVPVSSGITKRDSPRILSAGNNEIPQRITCPCRCGHSRRLPFHCRRLRTIAFNADGSVFGSG